MSSKDWGELRKREKTLDELKKSLRGRELSQRRHQNHRDGRKRKIDGLDENTRKLVTGKRTAMPGAPTKVHNSALIETICRIAISGSAADDRLRSEVIRTVKSLDDLTTSLRSEGFELSRSAVYLRLVSRNVRTIEGKRHVNVATVKLSRPDNSLHKNHVATKFAGTSIRYLGETAGFLVPEECTFHSQRLKYRFVYQLLKTRPTSLAS